MPRKTCTRCRRSFPREAFPVAILRGRGRTYRRSWCAECLRAYYRARNRAACDSPLSATFRPKPRKPVERPKPISPPRPAAIRDDDHEPALPINYATLAAEQPHDVGAQDMLAFALRQRDSEDPLGVRPLS